MCRPQGERRKERAEWRARQHTGPRSPTRATRPKGANSTPGPRADNQPNTDDGTATTAERVMKNRGESGGGNDKRQPRTRRRGKGGPTPSRGRRTRCGECGGRGGCGSRAQGEPSDKGASGRDGVSRLKTRGATYLCPASVASGEGGGGVSGGQSVRRPLILGIFKPKRDWGKNPYYQGAEPTNNVPTYLPLSRNKDLSSRGPIF